ncbi:MAG: DUF2177 family protein [Rhodospirillaceae bacterium]
MKRYAIAYAATATVFLILDAVWLGVVATDFFQSQLGHLLKEEIDLGVAAVFYAFYAIGIVIFGVRPALTSGRWQTAALFGGLFGFFAYATYDMTNYITLPDWPLIVIAVDVSWGTVASGVSAVCGFIACARMKNGVTALQ